MSKQYKFYPESGTKTLLFAGDCLETKVKVDESFSGKAFIRSNINQSEIRLADIIDEVELGRPNLDRGWYDLEIPRISETEFSLTIPLLKIGNFNFKMFLEENGEQIWPDGDNCTVNVEPPQYRSGNIIYCAFVRQFGPNKTLKETEKDSKVIEKLDKEGYTVIPPSGKFRDLIKELDHIIDGLGCNILHLLPINPTPTVYARMGRFGSPYAALDFTAVNPELAEFDLKATPLQQFEELVDAVHSKNAKVFIDIAINHTGWAAKLHETHPDWVKRNEDGTIHQPGAWGVVWEDLTELNHANKELWIYLAEVVLTWCDRGVDGFRCDAGYMIPEPAWRYITAKVRQKYPDTIFLLEGLGGPWETTESLLNTGNLNWAYSELFQNYDKAQISHYMDYSKYVSKTQGIMVHYAETHDNNRLAEKSKTWAKMRTTLCALLSHNGAFGFTNGVEWFADEKIFVHRSSGLNWGSKENQVEHIAELSTLLSGHPAFRDGSKIKLIEHTTPSVICFVRNDSEGVAPLLCAINLDCDKKAALTLDLKLIPESLRDCTTNLLSKITGKIEKTSNSIQFSIGAGDAIVTGEKFDLKSGKKYNSSKLNELLIMKILSYSNKDYMHLNLAEEAQLLLKDPVIYFNKKEIFTTLWEFPKDLKRHVLFSPYSVLIMKAPKRFRVKLFNSQLDSFKADDGYHYCVYKPIQDYGKNSYESAEFTIFGKNPEKFKSTLLCLTAEDTPFTGKIPDQATPVNVLDTNGRGGMLHACLNWPEFNSRYDCILGANLSKEFPENRHIMWRRLRVYCHHQAITLPLDENTLESREVSAGKAELIFRNPVGQGHFVRLKMTLGMLDGENASVVKIERLPALTMEYLPDNEPIYLFVRPDIEDRNFHMETKAHGHLENIWSKCIAESKTGFTFSPDKERILKLDSEADFIHEPEWSYNHFQRIEAERGLECNTDLFSPGYFKAIITGGKSVKVLGQILTKADKEISLSEVDVKLPPKEKKFEPLLREAMTHYIVKRGELKTVIAGYPWFLDWGRDTLICVRGIISAGFIEDVKKIILQFGSFEEKGTLPNMIHGGDASNRDTSDAPLWYFVAVEDLIKYEKSAAFLDVKAGSRTVKEVLISLAENVIKGTPNNIKMDEDSGLVRSPSHFTWMDTNYPAGTPREGYPVEIQSLWYKALTLLADVTDNDKWSNLAAKVKENFIKYFWNESRGFLSDCLHTKSGSAASAVADDALRCNQLLAVTLGLVDGEIAKDVIKSAEELLIPGAIRSLGDRPVKVDLPVYSDGRLLNDPKHPYWGNYEGDEDTRRKPAYHNGTAWSWPFPSYSEALYKVYGESAKKHAISILNSSRVLFDTGCLEQIPEVLDGNAPHRHRGCDAQAWGITEAYRVWKLLHG